MSMYSLQALEIARSIDGFIRNKFQGLEQRLEREFRSLREKVEEHVPSDAIATLQDAVTALAQQTKDQYTDLSHKLDELLALGQQQTVSLSVSYTMEDGTTETSQGGLLMKITDIQNVTARASEKDAKGNPVTLDPSKLVFASADPSKVSVTQNADGSATFAAVGPLTADAQGNDPGVQVSVTDGNLTQVDSIQVVSSAATSIGLAFDQPTDVAAAPVSTPPAGQ
jgi:hypothetical protein